jgi:hypothetical protein
VDRATVWQERADAGADSARAAAARDPNNKDLAKAVEEWTANLKVWTAARDRAVAKLNDAIAALPHHQAAQRKATAALKEATTHWDEAQAAMATPFKLAAEFRRVAPDAARKQLGPLAESKYFEVPAATLESLELHVRALRAFVGKSFDKGAVPNLAVAATAGGGKTTLLRYLQQKADTVRYGAELQTDTNWLMKAWNAPCSADSTDSKPELRHAFVGFANFSPGSPERYDHTQFDSTLDTTEMIEHRCVWRILFEAGLARRWNPDFRLTFRQAAEVLRAKISTAHGCMPEKVGVVFLIDDPTRILNDGARSRLLDKIAGWQQDELANGHLAVSIVGLPLFAVNDQWITMTQRQFTALPLPPLVKLPKELVDKVNNIHGFTGGREWDLLSHIRSVEGHPSMLAHIAGGIGNFLYRGVFDRADAAEQFTCLWHVFAASVIPGSPGFSVDADELATAPEYALHRLLLNRNCLRQRPATVTGGHNSPQIVLSATPSSLFLAGEDVWSEVERTSPGFPSYEAAAAVRDLMEGGIQLRWVLGLAGGLHLMAQCILYARLNQAGTPPPPSGQPQQALRGSVPFTDLVPGAIIGCQCDGLQYVVRDKFADSVDGALTRADLQRSRDASCVCSQPRGLYSDCLRAWDRQAIKYTFAAECGGEPVEVVAQHKFRKRSRAYQVGFWVHSAENSMAARAGGKKNVRVLICATGLSPTAIETIRKRAADANDPLSRAIIIDTATASQFFDRLGVFVFGVALKDRRVWKRWY